MRKPEELRLQCLFIILIISILRRINTIYISFFNITNSIAFKGLQSSNYKDLLLSITTHTCVCSCQSISTTVLVTPSQTHTLGPSSRLVTPAAWPLFARMTMIPPVLLGQLLHGYGVPGRRLLLHLVLEVVLAHNPEIHLEQGGSSWFNMYKPI